MVLATANYRRFHGFIQGGIQKKESPRDNAKFRIQIWTSPDFKNKEIRTSPDFKNYETYNRGEGFQLFARKIRQERSKGNHFLVLIYYYLFTI